MSLQPSKPSNGSHADPRRRRQPSLATCRRSGPVAGSRRTLGPHVASFRAELPRRQIWRVVAALLVISTSARPRWRPRTRRRGAARLSRRAADGDGRRRRASARLLDALSAKPRRPRDPQARRAHAAARRVPVLAALVSKARRARILRRRAPPARRPRVAGRHALPVAGAPVHEVGVRSSRRQRRGARRASSRSPRSWA